MNSLGLLLSVCREMNCFALFVAISLITTTAALQHTNGEAKRFIFDGLHLNKDDLENIPDFLKIIECTKCKCDHQCHAQDFDLNESDVCDPFMDTISCPVGDCLNYPCRNGGTCNPLKDGYRCLCTANWSGHNCETAVTPGTSAATDYCASSPCKNNGICKNEQNTFSCSCTAFWTGNTCEATSALTSGNTGLTDFCASSPCKNNGVCNNEQYTFSCKCAAGWTGNTCETTLQPQDPCASLNCANGNCTLSNGVASCTCIQGWKGNQCQTDINECIQKPCLNSGYCMNAPGSYSCSCKSGWEGNQCETDKDECLNNPCPTANATCSNTVGAYSCSCPSGWEGVHCEIDIDECARYKFCQNGATCVNTPGHFTCTCLSGWSGTQCNKDVDECLNNPCKHGTCSNSQGSYTCTCSTGWFGVNCDRDRNATDCDHICSLESAVKQVPITFSSLTCSGTSSFAPNDALLQKCCSIGDKSTWLQGDKVMTKCSSDTMKPFTPVAAFRNGVIVPETAGIFTGCLHNSETGFTVIRQDCSTNPSLYHINGTINGILESDPQQYYELF